MSVKHCPQCHTDLPANAPQGLCPACLLEQAVLRPREGREPAETSAQAGRFIPPTIEELGAIFKQLEILELLGQGGMGAVYKVRQRMLDRVVALKILPSEISRDPTFAERFTREARALAKLTHPNIVTVYEFGEMDGVYYLMMEFVDGVNLREAIQAESLVPAEALAVISQICGALQYAHDKGVVHRDIKPENVLLDTEGQVKIADFGLAKLLGLSPIEVTLTATHQVMGTFHYMAPEQLERPLEVDHRADIYSLGVVFYELLTGDLPLGRYKLPSEKRQLDVRLDNVVLKTLEREPKQRYQHVSELKTDVDHISSSNAAASPKEPFARARSVSRLPTVPFALSRGGMTLAHGVMRWVGDAIVLEFEVTEHAAMHPFYSNFKAKLHEVTIGLSDISAIRLDKGWFSGKLQIQAESVRIVSGIPGADRGRATLGIAAQDLDTAEEFVRAIDSSIAGNTQVIGSSRGGASGLTWNPGLLGFGTVMIGLGLGMLSAGVMLGQHAYLWTGIGVAIGGGCVGASAFMSEKLKQQKSRLVGPAIGLLVMAFAFVLVGVPLLIIGCVTNRPELVWVGFGIAIGGGSFLAGVWQEESLEKVDEPAEPVNSLPQKPPKLTTSTLDDVNASHSRLNIPAIGMCLAGAMDCLAVFGVVGLAIYVANVPSAGPPMPGILELIIIGGGSIFGVGELVGGINMLTRRSHAASIVGALSSSIPCGFTSFFSMPFGIWALIVLNTPAARREFEVAAETREQAALERDEY
ncbi:MAG: protein kinase [Planctomycetaceae bacterium]|nr:protein kinase [Planctomycetaceae bacterium]